MYVTVEFPAPVEVVVVVEAAATSGNLRALPPCSRRVAKFNLYLVLTLVSCVFFLRSFYVAVVVFWFFICRCWR